MRACLAAFRSDMFCQTYRQTYLGCRQMKRVWIAGLIAAVLQGGAARADGLTVFAAASLKGALDPVAAQWATDSGHAVVVSYGPSSGLAKQIEAGAPADLYLSAAESWMDYLDKAALIVPGSRVDLWGNDLAIVAHDTMMVPFAIDKDTDLAGILGGEKLAMALVDSVPAGQYGKEALVTLGLWDSVAPQVVQAEDVRAALALVAAGEAGFGVVYGSDAKAAEQAGQAIEVALFPADSHTAIRYPGAVVAGSGNAAIAAEFLTYLRSAPVQAAFGQAGFQVMP